MALLGASTADAGEPRRRFSIPAKSYPEALIDLALQGDLSLLGASACGTGAARAVAGVYTVRQALDRLLAGAPCAYRVLSDGSIRIAPQASTPTRAAGLATTPLSELQVSARRRPERLEDLPAGVSVISGEQIEASGARDVRDTAGQLVGVVTTNLGPGRDKLLMRGLSDGAFTGRTRSTVSTYLDDAPLNYNAPDPDLRLVDVERVEAVRGPQGSLYGAGALSGVYRIVTVKPDLQAREAQVTAIGANTQGGDPTREVQGWLNVPFAPGVAAVRLVGYYGRLGGFVDDVNLRLSNVDSTVRSGGRAALRVQPQDDWTIDLSGAWQQLRSNDTQYVMPLIGPMRRANRVREGHVNEFRQAALRLEGQTPWGLLTSSTSWVRHAYDSRYDASSALGLFAPGADLGVYSESARTRTLVQDVLLASRDEEPFGWLVGVFASSALERTPSFLQVRTAGRLASVYNEERSDRRSEVAVYGEASWRFAPGWTVAAGGRVYQIRRRTLADIVAVSPGQSREVAWRQRFRNISPKVSLQHQLPSGPLIYGLYSEGYRAGGVNAAGFLPVRPSLETFASDRLRNFELGAKARAPDERTTIRAAAFYDIWNRIQSDQYRGSGLPYTANVGDAEIAGFEAEVARRWDGGLKLQANVTVARPRFTRVNPEFADRLGAYLPGAPHVSAGVLARYDRSLGERLTLRIVADASYVGRSRLTFDPALSPRMGNILAARLSASVAAPRWSLGLFVTNPQNASGDTFAYGNPFSFGQVRQVTPQRPRTVGAWLTATY